MTLNAPVVIEIFDEPIETNRTWSKEGRSGQLPDLQPGYINLGGRFPQQFQIQLPDNRRPYAPGLYLLAPSAFAVGDFSSLIVKRYVELIPLTEAVQQLVEYEKQAKAPNAKAA